jgi:hypothetical protein
MVRCAALQNHRSGRDLAQLSELVDEVIWVDEVDVEDTTEPVVVSALWVMDNADRGRHLLRSRSDAGRATVLVPRFKGGDLAPLLGAPCAVEVRAGDFDGVCWDDGQQYGVPGVASFRTALHAGRWALAIGVGPVVLCFRAHTTAGPIVLCTAAATSRPPGVALQEQRRLISRILSEVGAHSMPPVPNGEVAGPLEPAQDLDAYLEEEGAAGTAVLLTLIACNGNRDADLTTVAREILGTALQREVIERILCRLPGASIEAMAMALRSFGWGAHLRQVQRVMAQKETP